MAIINPGDPSPLKKTTKHKGQTILTIGWVWPAFTALQKTCARKDWKMQEWRDYRANHPVEIWDKDPDAGGMPIGQALLTKNPYREPVSQSPDDDWKAEGLQWLGQCIVAVPGMQREKRLKQCQIESWDEFKKGTHMVWVVRFQPVRVYLHAATRAAYIIRHGRDPMDPGAGPKPTSGLIIPPHMN